jgi:hypothetical protein
MTINYNGHELDVDYDYSPAEKEVRYYSDGSGYPGCPEEWAINNVTLGTHDVTKLVDEDTVIQCIIDAYEYYYD